MFLDASINLTKIRSYKNIYHDVYVDYKTGAVLDSSLNPIYETLYETIFWWGGALHGEKIIDENLRATAVKERHQCILKELSTITTKDIKNAKVFNEDRPAIYALNSHGWYPYGHLHDALLRLYPWRNTHFDNPVVLCSKYNRVVDFPLHLKAFGFEENCIHRNSLKYRLVKVAQLYYGVNEAPYWTTSTAEQYDWMLDGYMSLFMKEAIDLTPIEGLYLSRNHIGRRGVLNNDEVEEYLAAKGFVTLKGDENLLEIISLFNRAKTIVGPHGSIFVNTIFCKNNAKIIEFCPKNRRDVSFKNKTKAAADYNHILVPADTDFNIEIDLKQLHILLHGQE